MSKSQKPFNTSRAKPVKKRRATGPKASNGRQTARRTTKAPVPVKTKQAILVDHLSRAEGATLAELVEATGWQPHSVRGALSGTLKKKLGLAVTSETTNNRGRVFRIG